MFVLGEGLSWFMVLYAVDLWIVCLMLGILYTRVGFADLGFEVVVLPVMVCG